MDRIKGALRILIILQQKTHQILLDMAAMDGQEIQKTLPRMELIGELIRDRKIQQEMAQKALMEAAVGG